MKDTEVLDAIAASFQQAADEQVALFKRPQPDYTVDNEDILARFIDAVEKLLAQREHGSR